MRLGIFTKPIHVEKITNFLTQHTDIDFIISTDRNEQKHDLYEYDIGVSYCWPWKVSGTDTKPWFNYHPGLPDHKGGESYVQAMRERRFGVCLMRMVEEYDSGEILATRPIIADPVNSQDLGNTYHYHLFQLFKDTVEGLEDEI